MEKPHNTPENVYFLIKVPVSGARLPPTRRWFFQTGVAQKLKAAFLLVHTQTPGLIAALTLQTAMPE